MSEVLLCGVGGWSGPLPGDPSNNSILSATPAFGGIDVSWTYPATNPHSVAHVIVYKSQTNDFNTAIERGRTSRTIFYDRFDGNEDTLYYYWITIVSINGTVGKVIGPAWATARPRIADMIEDLTGQIDAGHLAQSLKTEIDKITLTSDELTQEIANRVSSNAGLSAAIADVQSGITDSLSFIETETIERQQGQAALLQEINTIAAINTSNAAAVLTEETARVDADSALAEQIALVAASAGGTASLVLSETQARATADSALASQITTVQVSLGNQIASIETGSTVEIDALTGHVEAMYTAKLDVNGLIGGFGLINDGNQVEAGFDVDRFWIGRTGYDIDSGNWVKPFIIDSGTVYINEAAINKLTFSKLIDETGGFVVQNGKITANYLDGENLEITSGSYTSYAYPNTPAQGFYLGPQGLLIGDYYGNQFFQVDKNGTVVTPGMTSSSSGLNIGSGKFTVNVAGDVVVDNVDIRRRLVLETGITLPDDLIKGYTSELDDYDSGTSSFSYIDTPLTAGQVIRGTLKVTELTSFTDISPQSPTNNQPYYVAAYVNGGLRNYVGGAANISIQIYARLTVNKGYGFADPWSEENKLGVSFDYAIKLHSGSFTSFKLPDILWRVFKL